ncbi:MAG: helix-turn-helix domain-containing protein [Cyclobacteriaceae bacterium]
MSTNIRVKRICQFCGNEFIAQTTRTRYCSHICNSRDYKRKLKEQKVEKSDNETVTIKSQPILEIQQKDFLSLEDAAMLLGVSRTTLYRMRKDGALKFATIGKKKVIARKSIDQLISL